MSDLGGHQKNIRNDWYIAVPNTRMVHQAVQPYAAPKLRKKDHDKARSGHRVYFERRNAMNYTRDERIEYYRMKQKRKHRTVPLWFFVLTTVLQVLTLIFAPHLIVKLDTIGANPDVLIALFAAITCGTYAVGVLRLRDGR